MYDSARHRLLLFGGDGGATDFTPLGDLWQYDVAGNDWQQLKVAGTPPARWHLAAAVDEEGHKAYFMGGAGLGRMGNDRNLYEFDLGRDQWRRIEPIGAAPPSMQGMSLVMDVSQRALVLVGGLRHEDPGPATSSDVWVFDLTNEGWTRLDGGIELQRRDHFGGFDATTGWHVVAGGHISKTIGDFYEFGAPVQTVTRFRIRRKN